MRYSCQVTARLRPHPYEIRRCPLHHLTELEEELDEELDELGELQATLSASFRAFAVQAQMEASLEAKAAIASESSGGPLPMKDSRKAQPPGS